MSKAARDILIYFSPKRNVVAEEIIFRCGVCLAGSLAVVVALMIDVWVPKGSHGAWVQSKDVHGKIEYLSFRVLASL